MRKGIIGVLALAVIVAVGLYTGLGMKTKHVDFGGTATAAEASVQPSAGEHTGHDHVSASTDATTPVSSKTYAMGDPSAPVKIVEYASLSCSHCAEFHNHTMPEVKKELIDTGKVYFELVHFPTSASALDGALIAGCMPEERYHQFVSFLFEQQDKWAFDQNYRQILKQNAKLLGASEDMLEQCLNDPARKEKITAEMQDAQDKHGIKSTPSFVINGKETFSGALPYSEFKKKIDAHLPQEKVEQ